jgi:SAM-dependent methyltransferase
LCWRAVSGRLAPSERRRRAELRRAERQFDQTRAIRTSGLKHAARTDVVGTRWKHGHRHQAIDPRFDLRKALTDLAIPIEEFVFVDIGAGMGRAMFMAADLPFKRIVGVEYSTALVAALQENIRVAGNAGGRFEAVHQDALMYELPTESLIIFLYNPFDCVVMTEFVDNVRRSFQAEPRRIVAIYVTPICARAWEESGFVERVARHGPADVYDTGPVEQHAIPI